MSEQVRAKVAPAPGIKRKRHRWTRDDTELGLLGLPTFIWYVLFSYLPMFGLIIAFKKLYHITIACIPNITPKHMT